MSRQAKITQPVKGEASYTHRDLVTAVNASALLGWVASEIILSGGSLLPFSFIVGMPIAFILCWSIAAPVLRAMMRSPISWLRAAVWGAGISGTFACLGIIVYFTAVAWFGGGQVGYGDFTQVSDHAVTPYGLWLLAQTAAQIMLAGTAIALIIRAKIGPGTSMEN